jgi:hypothetical protein
MIKAIFDTVLNTWNIENTGAECYFVDIYVGVRDNGNLPVNLRGLQIEVTDCVIFKNGVSTNSDYLFSKRIAVRPNVVKSIAFKANEVVYTISITPPLPVKPEGDWIWDSNHDMWIPTKTQDEKMIACGKLANTDAKMARAFEDLVAVLGVEDSLPQAVKDHITYRRELRSKIAGNV